MNKDLSIQVELMFAALNRRSAASSLPEPGTLSELLSKYVIASSATRTVAARPQELTYFATAAVEIWLRSVHSFLISAALTKASPIWASVAGYYSSHYSVRAFAHLFGVFQLHNKKRVVRLARDGNRPVFLIERKDGGDREHRLYWKCVSAHPQLATDPFFCRNQNNVPVSDADHRNKANYWDHVDGFPIFAPLEMQFLRNRIERIATIEFSDVPVPRTDNYPDINNVQIVAYHRLVKFRQFVDEVLGARNRFWNVNRKPAWCPDAMNFSVVEPVFAALYAGK
jgi:hypothetical protein